MFVCKEICLECRVRDCMTETRKGKLCPASGLAPPPPYRTQAYKSQGSGREMREIVVHAPQKCSLNLEETNTISAPSGDVSGYQRRECAV